MQDAQPLISVQAGQQDVQNPGPSISIGGRLFWTRAELAAALRKSPQTLAGWATRSTKGRQIGPKFIKCGRDPLYPHDAVIDWLNRQSSWD